MSIIYNKSSYKIKEIVRKQNETVLQTPIVSIIQYRETPEQLQSYSVENPILSKVKEMEIEYNKGERRLIFGKDNNERERAWVEREVRTKRSDTNIQTPNVSIIQYRETPEQLQSHSLENPDLSKVEELEIEYNKGGRKVVFEKDTTIETTAASTPKTNKTVEDEVNESINQMPSRENICGSYR
jgi:hypothetical protein